jgi:hypothetical protein
MKANPRSRPRLQPITKQRNQVSLTPTVHHASKEAGTDNGGQSDRNNDTHRGQAGTHMFGVLPNYATVENATAVTALTAQQKFRMASLNTFDPYV